MLLLFRNSTLAPAFRLKPSVLAVATRRFLATSPTPPPPKVQKKAETPRPHRYTKKELKPPVKRPSSSFVSYLQEKLKERKARSQPISPLVDIMRECSVAWKNLSEKEKQVYAPKPGEHEAYRAAVKKWYEGLSPEAIKAIKVNRWRRTGTGFALFLTETFKEAKGEHIGAKVSERSVVWKSLATEKRKDYEKRAAETLFGVRAKRARIRERELKRKAAAKDEAKKRAQRVKLAAKNKREKEKKSKQQAEKLKKAKDAEDKRKEKNAKKAKEAKEAERLKKAAKETKAKVKTAKVKA